MEEWKLTREQVKKEIYAKDKDEIEVLERKLNGVDNSENEANLYWQLSEKYKILFWGYAEESAIFKNTPKEDYYKQLEKDYLWKSVYYREKCLKIIKENNMIEANDGFFMDVGLKYRYFITYDYNEIKEKRLWFDRFGDTPNEKINMIINDIKYARRGLYYIINTYRSEENNEELFVWSEVMGDLFLIIQLLLLKGGRKDLLDNARQSLLYYKASRDYLKTFAKPTTHYDGIYGLPYQINFFETLLKDFEFSGYSHSTLDKMEFIEKKLLKKKSNLEYYDYLDSSFHNNKIILNNRILKIINKYPIIKFKGKEFEDWKIVVNFIHDHLLSFNYEQRDLHNEVNSWKKEDDMQKWLQRIMNFYLIEKKKEPSFYSWREVKVGGGNCDHIYKSIPICDKWKRDSNAKDYPIKIDDFIEKVYKDHYEQLKSYAHDVKLAVLMVVDSREVIRNKNPDLIKDCYKFIVNEKDGIILAVFIVQISKKTPSKRR